MFLGVSYVTETISGNPSPNPCCPHLPPALLQQHPTWLPYVQSCSPSWSPHCHLQRPFYNANLSILHQRPISFPYFLCPSIFSLTLLQLSSIPFGSSDAMLLTFGLRIHSLLCLEYCPLLSFSPHLTIVGPFTVSPL